MLPRPHTFSLLGIRVVAAEESARTNNFLHLATVSILASHWMSARVCKDVSQGTDSNVGYCLLCGPPNSRLSRGSISAMHGCVENWSLFCGSAGQTKEIPFDAVVNSRVNV